MRLVKRLMVCFLLVSLVACGGDEQPARPVEPAASPTRLAPATPSPSPLPVVTGHPSPTVASLCPNEIAARADESLRTGGVLEADVDGDGSTEEVWIAIDPEATSVPCRAFVVVRSSDGGLRSGALSFQEFSGPGLPKLHGLIEVTPVPGYEIVVDVTAGASTQFVALYAVSGELVVQIVPRGVKEAEGGLFGYGGSVGHLDAIDCLDGRIVVSTAVPSGEGVEYRVTRRDYEPQGLVLIPRGRQNDLVDLDELERYPEFGSSPLGSCARA